MKNFMNSNYHKETINYYGYEYIADYQKDEITTVLYIRTTEHTEDFLYIKYDETGNVLNERYYHR